MLLIILALAFASAVQGASCFPIDPAAVNRADAPQLGRARCGPAVLRAQILLDRAHFSPGEIDGRLGSNTQKTLVAFQRERGLQATGSIDKAVWKALNSDTAPVLTEYEITPEDVAGPFSEIPKGMMEQAQLPSLGFRSPVEELGERFHSAPAVLRGLNPGADFGKARVRIQVPNTATPPPPQAAKVVVSKSESSVRAYDAGGKLVAFYVATIGSEHDPLPIGDWKILGVQRHPKFHYNAELFWDAQNKDEKAVLPPGPNGPVGVVWIDLSKEHYGIHGTPEPAEVGHAASHGCIRLTNWDAWELASMVKPGTPAILGE